VKKLLKKYISVILMAFILINCIPINTAAGFSDIPENAAYTESLDRMISLGIIADSVNFNPDSLLTREQFAKMIVIAAGLENTAISMKGSTIFPDIAASAWSSGYINVAVNKGYITGWYDGKFRPSEPITMAQICTSFLKVLGYTYQDMTGEWPDSYIIKAAELGLTDGISINKNAGMPRWAAVKMLDRLLNTNMKTPAGQTFIDSTGYYTKCTVLGDSSILDSLTEGQVLTDKGTYNNPSNIKLELGSENYIAIKNGNIQRAAALSSVLKVSVDQATGNRVSYKDGDIVKSILLPSNITYYYNGQKADYNNVLTMLQKSVSIVFNYTADKSGYSFAVVFDPVYSKPEIAEDFVPDSGRLGTIIFGSNPLVMRNESIISLSEIEPKDVVYQVTDIWGANKYFVAVDNKIGGKITDIIPNNLSPKTLQINGANYEFSPDIDINEITGYTGDLVVDNNIVVYLGHDGKIVNVEGFGIQDNSDYAVVMNTGSSISTEADGTRKVAYTAKLQFSDGVTATYNVASSASQLKGKLVKCAFIDSGNISLEQVSYNFLGATNVEKDARLLGDSYVADNVRIFDIVYNDGNAEVQVNMLKWSDFPGETIPDSKIMYTNTAGPFNDINIILTDDVFNQRYKTGVVSSVGIVPSAKGSSYTYTILVDSEEYNYSVYNTALTKGSVLIFKMSGTGIESLSRSTTMPITATNIQAIDSRRIKLNDHIYFFNKNISVYYKDPNGTITAKTLADLDTNKTYQNIAVYTDSGTGTGKVNVIYVSE